MEEEAPANAVTHGHIPHARSVPRVTQNAENGGTNILSLRDTNITTIQNARLRTKRISDWLIAESGAAHFLGPTEYPSMRDILWRSGVLVLNGPRSSGKKFLGTRLLLDCQQMLTRKGRANRGIYEIKMGWEEIAAREIPRIPGTCYFLDLTDSTDERPTAEFGEDLIRDAASSRDDGVFLVVSVTPDVWTDCAFVTADVTPLFEPRNAFDVAASHLRFKHGVVHGNDWLSDTRFVELLSKMEQPSEAARLAAAVAERVSRADVEKAKLEVLDEFESWRRHLSDWFSRNEAVPDRAAMIAAAVLDPSTPSAILDARNRLLEQIGEVVDDQGPLSGPGRSGYLQLLEASETKDGFSISATRHGLNEAVIPYVWTEWPQVQKPLQAWLLTLAGRATPDVMKRISLVIVRTGVRVESTAFMELARRSVVEGIGNRELALSIVDQSVLDPRVGAKVRQRLLQWASSNNEKLSTFVAQACTRVLGRERPTLALKRICRVLSRSECDAGTNAAEEALLALAEDEVSRSTVLDIVGEWIAGAERQVGIQAFVVLASRSRSFVAECLSEGHPDAGVEMFERGWSAAATSTHHEEAEVAASLRDFLGICESVKVSNEVVERVVGPVLADSLNKNLAMGVLRDPSKLGDKTGESSIREHLVRELIWGQLGQVLGAGETETGSDA